jgi:hypothetical protein
VDPHWFTADPDPALWSMRFRIPFLVHIWIQGFDDQKSANFTAEENSLKIAIYLFLGLHEGRLSDRETFNPKSELLALQNTIFFKFVSVFVGHFCPPGYATSRPNQCGSFRIWIHNTAFDQFNLNIAGNKPEEPLIWQLIC